jgi:hypothetical protein
MYHTRCYTASADCAEDMNKKGGYLLYETKACYECVASAIAFLENKYVIAAANPKINIIRRAQWAIGKQNRFCRMKLLN